MNFRIDPNKDKKNQNDLTLQDRHMAEKRHDIDSGIFQGRYVNFKLGRLTDEFIYGRYQIFEEVKKDLKNLKPNSKILDLGCGTGHLSKFISDLGHEVIGIDPSKKMLSLAMKNFPEISFIDAISVKLPFEDNTFDYVVSIEVLRYLHKQDVLNSYKEIFRVLKPSGFFNVTHVNRWATDFYYIYYFLIKFSKTLKGINYHNCYFTNANREIINIKKIGFKRVFASGRMFATIRISYKFGLKFGRFYCLLLEIINKRQYFSGFYKNFAGHLVLRGYK